MGCTSVPQILLYTVRFVADSIQYAVVGYIYMHIPTCGLYSEHEIYSIVRRMNQNKCVIILHYCTKPPNMKGQKCSLFAIIYSMPLSNSALLSQCALFSLSS